MATSSTVSPRRVTNAEAEELLAAVRKETERKAAWQEALADRDQLIADLAHANARISDIAEITGLTSQGVRDARDRALRSP